MQSVEGRAPTRFRIEGVGSAFFAPGWLPKLLQFLGCRVYMGGESSCIHSLNLSMHVNAKASEPERFAVIMARCNQKWSSLMNALLHRPVKLIPYPFSRVYLCLVSSIRKMRYSEKQVGYKGLGTRVKQLKQTILPTMCEKHDLEFRA